MKSVVVSLPIFLNRAVVEDRFTDCNDRVSVVVIRALPCRRKLAAELVRRRYMW